MALTLDRIEQESKALHEALATGASVVEIDPDPSILPLFATACPTPGAATFDALKKSIEDHGQEVPDTRPTPSKRKRSLPSRFRSQAPGSRRFSGS